MTSEQLEAENRDLLFLMMYREPSLIDRLMRRFLKCLKINESWRSNTPKQYVREFPYKSLHGYPITHSVFYFPTPMHKRLLTSLIFLSCAGNVTPNFYEYRDVHERTHIYQVDIDKLSQRGENLTEYYYCIEHEKLEEIKLVFDTPVTEVSPSS